MYNSAYTIIGEGRVFMGSFDVEKILRQMTLEEKAQICSGRDFWRTQDVERLGIPKVMMCDGPNGLRKQIGESDALGINESIETVCYPTASAVAASFDTELLQELGEILGEECQAEHVGMLLGPGINMKRSPLCGRNFEYFSEDPYLAENWVRHTSEGCRARVLRRASSILPVTIRRHGGCQEVPGLMSGHCVKSICRLLRWQERRAACAVS